MKFCFPNAFINLQFMRPSKKVHDFQGTRFDKKTEMMSENLYNQALMASLYSSFYFRMFLS